MNDVETLITGAIYYHFKGNKYRLLLHSVKSANEPNTLFVVYQSLEDGTTWMREQNEFMGYHENGCKRFVLGEQNEVY